ncbi:bifunctional diguanylate cyclase/phosphodiesterase [Fibrobacter sp. UWEL]|uniref:putative bifunctional diguanylate cyclase/phosphodiesterase n=1 Tax=Fibrobacter sp. UWEL TaxID=1896209 RepID=UPI00091C1A93|nr:GGDEF domain-containing phosphodiesterase [Fibrobacter sp. UWEL]SHL30574.1 diguanylate cyclase (GGDEF) domain-containing protein [Fibrobacter sp. UWEL]
MLFSNIGEAYCKFREALSEPNASMKTFPAKVQAVFPPLAKELHIGGLASSLNAPTSEYAPNGEEIVQVPFQDPSVCPVLNDNEAHMEQFATKEHGSFTILFYPEKDHQFNEQELQICRLLANDFFVLGGRARLMDFMEMALSTDPMTKVDNQPTLTRKMGMLAARGMLKDFAGIFINLKNFKYINKSLSSPIGDLAIKLYANAIKNSLEEFEIVCRLGGDNFYVLVKKDNLQKFIDRFSKFEVKLSQGPKPVEFVIQARMGIYPATPKDGIPELMNNASIALNVAKEQRSSDLIYFSTEMHIQAMHRREISTEFRNALQNHEFIVHYQPKVNIRTKQLCGSEALVRWIRHKTIVPPMDFVPILEQEGSICQLDFYVFKSVCRDIQQWVEAGIPPVRISVNFSKRHLKNPNFAEDILNVMKQHKVESQFIEVELTEVSDYDDYKAMQRFVTIMRQNGISVSIDDFGTGYSTLTVLKNFDVNVIKLDKSLLDNIGKENSMDEVVVKNVVNLAKEMNKEVIAEGVESEAQAKFLEEVNCNNVQGFLFDKPLNHDDFQKRLTGENPY